jgi:hypothetical protein
MKSIFLLLAVGASTFCVAQPKLINQAIITTSTNVIAPEDEDVSQVGQGGGGGGFNFRNMMDGETKSTTYVKNDLVKTNMKSESFKGSIFRNNTTKTTTTIFEAMGNTQGVVATDDEQADARKKMDSVMAERAKTDTNMRRRTRTVDVESTVAYTEETKKIAGYNCKKAYVITDRIIRKDSLTVWITTEIKFPNLTSTGGLSGIPMARMFGGGGATNFDKVDGFVMQYETKMPGGRVMEVKVTKIEIDKEIAVKEFDIPKDIEIKTMKEMGGQMGGFRMQGQGR